MPSLRPRLLTIALLALAACSDSGSTGTENNPAPTVSGLTPSSTAVGSAGLTLAVEGTGFTETSSVLWGGASRTTEFISHTRIQTSLSAGDLDESGTVAVSVRTPAPGGGTSGTLGFTIQAPGVTAIQLAPADTSLVPDQQVPIIAVLLSADQDTLSDRTISWSSSDPDVAGVDDDGVVTGGTPGAAVITASSEGITEVVDIAVLPGGMARPEGSTLVAGGVTLTVPAGAVSGPTALTATPNANPPAGTEVVAGTAFDLGPDGSTFDPPLTVEIAYDPNHLPAGAAAADLEVHRWNGAAWEALADGAVDSVAHRVSGSTTAFSPFAILHVPGIPQWRRVDGHPGEEWAERWGDWTVAVDRLWVVESGQGRDDNQPRIHWSLDGEMWQSEDPESFGDFGPEDPQVGFGNGAGAAGTDDEVVIRFSLAKLPPDPPNGELSDVESWVVRGTPGNWTVQNPTNTPGLRRSQIADDGRWRFRLGGTSVGMAWDDRVVFLGTSKWWDVFATTDVSFLSLTTDASDLWQMFAKREYPWGGAGSQWMTGGAATPWGFFGVGHLGFDTEVWFSADGHDWDLIDDPVDSFGGSLDRVAQVWSGAMMYGPRGLLMARARANPSEELAAWYSADGQSWEESVIHNEIFGDPRGFVAGDTYVVMAGDSDRASYRRFDHIWVSRDAENWVRIPPLGDELPGFVDIIGWGDRLWGFREGEVWTLDLSRMAPQDS